MTQGNKEKTLSECAELYEQMDARKQGMIIGWIQAMAARLPEIKPDPEKDGKSA